MLMNSKGEQRKHNTTPSSSISVSPKLLPRRRKHQSSGKKRKSSAKLTKDEIRYQRFVHDLQRNIQVYMKECLRESRFDNNPCSKMNPSFQLLRATSKSRRAPSSIGSHRTNETETIITSISNRQDPISFLKYNETKRLTADVETILAGPAMKNFYTQFIRPVRPQQSIPLEDSFFNVSDH